jgi:phage replication initiation protein
MNQKNLFVEPLKTDWVSGVSLDWLEWTFTEKKYIPAHEQRATREIYAAAFAADSDPDADHDADPCRTFWTVGDVLAFLGELGEQPAETERGMLGYRRRATTSAGVMVLWDGSPGMGVHVSVPGAVVQTLPDAVALVVAVVDAGGKFSRIDIAIDDHENILSLTRLHKKCKRGECSSRVKEWRLIESGTIKDGSITGRTLYFGSRESDFMARFYDKLLEMKKKLKRDKPALKKLPKFWNRAEAELKGDAAINAAKMLVSGQTLAQIGRGVIHNYLSFKTRFRPNKKTGKMEWIEDTNKGRWSVAPFWQKWIDGADKIRVARQIESQPLDKKLIWLKTQCGKTIFQAMETIGGAGMMEIYKSGRASMQYKDALDVYFFNVKAYRKALQRWRLDRAALEKPERPTRPKKPATAKEIRERSEIPLVIRHI